MSLVKNVGTIGGLTAISRVFGFVRDMMMARVVGAGLVADAFQLAFTLPNTFRRLFAEGAFSVAFVPMYSRALHGDGGEEAANRFANDVLSVFVWVLLLFSAAAMVFMPAIVTGLVISSSAVATSTHAVLDSLFGAIGPYACCSPWTKIFSTIVLFLAYEIGYWVDHYLKHRVPFLWEFHKLHHTADVLTPLTNFRNHPIDNIIFGYMLAFFIGGASGVLEWLFNQHTQSFTVDGKNILFIVFLWTIGHLQHSQFWIPFRGVWGRLILSPAHHQIHHSRDPAHYNRNLGSVLAVWDWAFGTLEIPTTKNPHLVYGADNAGAAPHSTFGILVTSMIQAAQTLRPTLENLIRSGGEAWSAFSDKTSRSRNG